MATEPLVGMGANKGLLTWLLAGGLLLSTAAVAQTHKSGTHRRIRSDEAIAARAVADAEAAIEKKDWATAEHVLLDVVARNSQDYRAWFDLGFVFNETDRRPEAIAAYRRSVTAKPDVFESNLNL